MGAARGPGCARWQCPNAGMGAGPERYGGISRGQAEGWRWGTTDMLIRDVPDDVIAALDAHGRRFFTTSNDEHRAIWVTVDLATGTIETQK